MAAVTSFLIGTAIAGTALNAYGQVKAGKAQQAAAESEAERAEFNAQVAEVQAADALARGREEESIFRQGVRGLIGSQRAGFAGQGVKVGVGSAADVVADTAYQGELDARRIRANAEREAWGYQMEAADLRMGADVSRRAGKNAAKAGWWNAGSTVLGATSSILQARMGWGESGGGAGLGGSSTLPSRRVGGAMRTYNAAPRIR